MMSIFEQIHAHPAERLTGQILCILVIAAIIAAMRRGSRELGRTLQSHTYQPDAPRGAPNPRKTT